MRAAEDEMTSDPVLTRALLLAEEFLAAARVEILELAAGDLDHLRASATALRSAAADRSTAGRSAEQIAYLIVASTFNQVLAARDRR
jgi:hypothetical protein